MATRTPKYVRESIVSMLEARRQSGRCALVKELTDEGKALSTEYDEKIGKLEAKRTKLWKEVMELADERDKLLEDGMLHDRNFTKSEKGTCRWRPLNPRLEAYDAATDHGILEIMMRETVDESILQELCNNES